MALPLDALELISKKLTFAPDYTRFRSVCKAWRSAAPKQPQLPWLILTEDDAGDCSKFYQFSFEADKFTQIPELSSPSLLSSFLDNPRVFIRSSRGWLFLLDLYQSVSLINPLTDSIINLPNLHFEDYYAFERDVKSHGFGFSLTSDPGESSPECFALIYYSERISYCKVGSNVWIEMQHPKIYGGSNIHICCYNGKLFLASGGDVFACEFGDNPSVCKLGSLWLNDNGISAFIFQDSYLVDSDGDLLLVLVLEYLTCEVFKLEFGEQQVKLVELKSLGDRTLFLSLDATFSVVASKYPGCRKNSVYIPEFLGRFSEQTTSPTLIMYDCEEEDCRFIPTNYVHDWNGIRCAWFTPSLLM